MQMNKAREGLRWVVFLAGIISLIYFLINWEIYTKGGEESLTLLFLLLPAFGATVLSLFRQYWIVCLIGLWFIFIGVVINGKVFSQGYTLNGIYLIVSGLILLFSPLLDIVLRESKNTKIDKKQDSK